MRLAKVEEDKANAVRNLKGNYTSDLQAHLQLLGLLTQQRAQLIFGARGNPCIGGVGGGEERKKKKKHTLKHRYKKKNLFCLEIVTATEEVEPDWPGFDGGKPQPSNELPTNPSAAGVAEISSIRLVGKILRKEVGFLVYTDAIYKFINPATAKRPGLQPSG